MMRFQLIVLSVLVCLLRTIHACAEDNSVERFGGRTLEEWQFILQDFDPQSPQSTEYISGLSELIQQESVPWITRRQAAYALARMGAAASSSVPIIIQLLDTKEADSQTTRLWAGKALALFGPYSHAAAPRLAELAQCSQESFALRVTAIEALARIGADAPAVLPALIELLGPHTGLAGEETLQTRMLLRMAAAEGLELLGPTSQPALPNLIHALRDGSSFVRLHSIKALGAIGPAAEIAIPSLADAALFDDSPEVSDAAAMALGSIGPPAIPAFEQLLQDADVEVRLRAVRGLSRLGESGHDLLQKASADEDALVAAWGAAGLIHAAPNSRKAAILRLLNLLESPRREVRIQVYRTLKSSPELLIGHRPYLEVLTRSESEETARASNDLLRHVEIYIQERSRTQQR